MQGGRILVYKPSYPFIFRREWDNVTCTSEKWKYERRIYSLCKILWANLGVKTWSRHILGCCHIYFIKPQTYSARLPPKANDSPHIWNDFMRVTKHFLQSIFRYYDLCMTHFFIILCGLNTYICLPYHFSCSFKYNDLHFQNPTIAKRNIWVNIFQIPRHQSTHLYLQ